MYLAITSPFLITAAAFCGPPAGTPKDAFSPVESKYPTTTVRSFSPSRTKSLANWVKAFFDAS